MYQDQSDCLILTIICISCILEGDISHNNKKYCELLLEVDSYSIKKKVKEWMTFILLNTTQVSGALPFSTCCVFHMRYHGNYGQLQPRSRQVNDR